MDPLKSKITMKEKTKKTKRMQQMSAKGGASLMVTRLNVYKNGNVSLARINVDRLAEMLRTGGRYVEQVEALRHDLAHHRGRGIDFTFDKTVERIIPQSLVAQRGGNWTMTGYEGIVMLKLENVFGDEAAQAVKRAAALMPMTLMAFTGASGMSAYILVRVSVVKDAKLLWRETEQMQAFHQSFGSCSDHPGSGKYIGYSFVTVLSIFPDLSASISFTAEVPRSIPM